MDSLQEREKNKSSGRINNKERSYSKTNVLSPPSPLYVSLVHCRGLLLLLPSSPKFGAKCMVLLDSNSQPFVYMLLFTIKAEN